MKKIYLFCVILLCGACSKCVVRDDSCLINSSSNINSIEAKNEMIRSYAQLLASSLESTEMRTVIKAEAEKQFDGDYDILTSHLHEINLSKGDFSVKNKLNEHWIKTRSTNDLDLESLLVSIQKEFPNLQVSIPVHCEEWDAKDYIPLVAFLPYDYDDQVDSTIVAFDSELNEHMLSLEEDPKYPVIVVSRSERVDDSGSLKTGFLQSGYSEESTLTESVPDTPSGINLLQAGARMLELEWKDTDNETGYEVYQKTDGQSYSLRATLPADQNYYLDNYLTPGKKYSYRVKAINDKGTSAYSTVISTYASDRNGGDALVLKKMYFTDAA